MRVDELKNKILQLAIQGKLVPQDEKDIPASVLLEEIKKEKEQLIKEKKIKREKPLPEITEEEKLFEIPKGWEWCRLGEIGQIIGGGTPSSSNSEYYSDNEIPWITPADLRGYDKKYISNGGRYISKLGLQKSSAQLLPIGSVLFSSRAPIGYVVINDKELSTNQGFKSIVPFDKNMNEFIYYFLKYNKSYIEEISSGTTFKEISGSGMKNLVIPLPSVAEQLRIVQKVDELFAIIDELAENKEAMLKNISDTRNKVLQLAIQGKLVEQNPEDTPASVLLEEIRKEKEQLIKEKKIKKEKPLPEITEEEKPFEIPKGWEWVRFGEMVSFNIGKTPPRKDKTYWDNAHYPWVSISDMVPNGKIKETKEYINENSFNNIFKGKISPKGTLLMSFKLTVGRVSILDIEALHNEAIISIYPFSDKDNIIQQYLFKVLPLLSQYGNSKSAIKGNTLNSNSINELLIPLPSVAEQQRIVQKVDEIMSYLDELEKIII